MAWGYSILACTPVPFIGNSFPACPVPSCTFRLAEALVVNDLPLPQEADGVLYIRIIRQTQYVVVGGAGFLLWCNHV